jgi:hypothetical protein
MQARTTINNIKKKDQKINKLLEVSIQLCTKQMIKLLNIKLQK